MEVPLVARLLGAQDAEPAVADEHGVVHAQDVRITRSDPRDLKQFGGEGAINSERLGVSPAACALNLIICEQATQVWEVFTVLRELLVLNYLHNCTVWSDV